MCVVSMVGDYYKDRTYPTIWPNSTEAYPSPVANKKEFDELKKSVEELKELLKAAKKYDEKLNEPHCETDEKVAFLKKVAEWVGVDLKDVL